MASLVAVVLPIFALLLAGWIARRSGVLGATATGELNRFVVHLALPALLFDIVAHAEWSQLWRPDFVGAFGLASAVVFAATVAWRLRTRPLPDAAIDGLNAAYANTGFMGFPLAQAAFGPASLAPTLVATILTVCVLLAVALTLIEIGSQDETDLGRTVVTVAKAVARNPLLIAPAVGALCLVFGIAVPEPLERFTRLLGAAASPCALVTLGLFLAEPRPAERVPVPTVGTLVALKLIAQPALTWWLAASVFGLPREATQTAVLLAALPTGTGSFMVAEYYQRDAGVTSRAVLWSTVASVVTLTVYLAAIGDR